MTNLMTNPNLPPDLVDQMFNDRKIRTAIVRQSHFWFFHFYFPHYVTYETAPFQRELFHYTERTDIQNLFVVAFRGSGKSTILTMSYPIWAILGQQQKKFVIIICQTRTQAKQHMVNLKRELENNLLLKNDLGPFQEEADEWGSFSLVFSNLNARISAVSSEQSIRGLRHNQYRPDLIIGDDVEDIASSKTHEGRQKTYQWLKGEVMPAGDKGTRLIIVGNLLHEDSLLMHLKRDIDEGKTEGLFKQYPLLGENNEIAWLGKYPALTDVELERRKLGNEIAWQREFLLHIVPDEDQVIHRDWLHFYDELPKDRETMRKVLIGVDLAISQKESADYTAMVSALVCGHDENFRVFILPHPVNARMEFPATILRIKQLQEENKRIYPTVETCVEDVGYQAAVIQQLNQDGVEAKGVKVTTDKRSRLMSISNMIQTGKILFPRHGAEGLIRQILGFGVERHDDLVDAFTIIGHQAIDENKPGPGFYVFAMREMDHWKRDPFRPDDGLDRFRRQLGLY